MMLKGGDRIDWIVYMYIVRAQGPAVRAFREETIDPVRLTLPCTVTSSLTLSRCRPAKLQPIRQPP